MRLLLRSPLHDERTDPTKPIDPPNWIDGDDVRELDGADAP